MLMKKLPYYYFLVSLKSKTDNKYTSTSLSLALGWTHSYLEFQIIIIQNFNVIDNTILRIVTYKINLVLTVICSP